MLKPWCANGGPSHWCCLKPWCTIALVLLRRIGRAGRHGRHGKPRPGIFASSSPSLATAPSWCWHIYVILVRLRQEIAAVFSPASTHERAREKDDKMGRDRREQILRVCHSQTIICHKPVFWPRSKSHLVDSARSS